MAELAEHENEFAEQGAQLAVIGNGAVKQLPGFREATGFQGLLLTDPSRRSFKLLGFSSGLAGLVGRKSLFKGFAALKAGHMPGSLQGSALQLGGAIIVQADGSIVYYFQSSEAGDHPLVADMLEAVA